MNGSWTRSSLSSGGYKSSFKEVTEVSTGFLQLGNRAHDRTHALTRVVRGLSCLTSRLTSFSAAGRRPEVLGPRQWTFLPSTAGSLSFLSQAGHLPTRSNVRVGQGGEAHVVGLLLSQMRSPELREPKSLKLAPQET